MTHTLMNEMVYAGKDQSMCNFTTTLIATAHQTPPKRAHTLQNRILGGKRGERVCMCVCARVCVCVCVHYECKCACMCLTFKLPTCPKILPTILVTRSYSSFFSALVTTARLILTRAILHEIRRVA